MCFLKYWRVVCLIDMNCSDPSLAGVKIDGTPFNVLMEQAVAMKSEQLSADRRKYDSWPSWLRNSLIVSDVSFCPF